MPIHHSGSEAQKEKCLPALRSDEMIGCHSMSEPGYGSHANSLRTRTEHYDSSYLLNGTKVFVTSAPIADMALVFATIDSDRGWA